MGERGTPLERSKRMSCTEVSMDEAGRCHVALENPLQYKPCGSKQGLRNKTPQRLEHESFFRLNLRLSIVTIKDCCHEFWRYSVLWGLRCSGHDEIEVKEPCARQFLRTKGLCSFSLGPS
eukprot:jgi/Botrbrau1/1643/Bobra.0185s0053.1